MSFEVNIFGNHYIQCLKFPGSGLVVNLLLVFFSFFFSQNKHKVREKINQTSVEEKTESKRAILIINDFLDNEEIKNID